MSAALRLPVMSQSRDAREGDATTDTPTRPRTRGECIDGQRPCPWVSCTEHTVHGLMLREGGDALTDDDLVEALTTLSATCVLDVADEGVGGEDATLQIVGEILGVTRERVRQIEAKALRRVRRASEDLRADLSEDALPAALAKPVRPARIDWMGEGDDPAETDTAPAAMGAEETNVKVQRKNLPAPARASTGSGVHVHATAAVCVVPGCGAPPKAWRIELAPELRGLCALHRQRALRWRVDYPQQSAAAALAWVLSRAEATQAQGAQGAEAARHDVFEDEQREACEALEPPVRPAPADVSELARAQVSLDAAARALEEQNAVAARLREERDLATAALARVREELERDQAALRDATSAVQGLRDENGWLLSQRDAARAEAAELRRDRDGLLAARDQRPAVSAPSPWARLSRIVAELRPGLAVTWHLYEGADGRWGACALGTAEVHAPDEWDCAGATPDEAIGALVAVIEGAARARIEALTAAMGGA